MASFNEVQQVINKIRPYLQNDGGDCHLVDVKDGIVKVRLVGACIGCPSSTVTLKIAIEKTLMEELPGQIIEVQQIL